MTAPKRSKGPPMKLRWYELLQEWRDIPRENPSAVSVVAVTGVLMTFADSDGRNCYPAIQTIVRRARVSKRTVRLVLGWLVETGWLTVTRKVERRPTIYRLTIPVGAEAHLPETVPWVPTSTYQESAVGAVVGAVVGADGHQDIRTPNVSEEEDEGAIAPLPDGRGAAPFLTVPLERFTDHLGPASAVASTETPPTADLLRVARDTARWAGTSIDPRRLTPAVAKAMAETGWCRGEAVVYCVELLWRNKAKDPTAFLVTDLTTRVNADTMSSARMQLARELHDVYHFADSLPGVGGASVDELFGKAMVEAGLIEEECDFPDEALQVKPQHVEQVIEIIEGLYPPLRVLAEAASTSPASRGVD